MAIKRDNRNQKLQEAMNTITRTTGNVVKKGATLVAKDHARTVHYTVRNTKVMDDKVGVRTYKTRPYRKINGHYRGCSGLDD